MPKRHSTYAGLALLVTCGAAFAQQPLTLPGRSQSSAQQAVDNAACYAYANQTSKVVMARESQAPQKDNAVQTRTLISPRAVEPPLPPTASGALAASAASGAVAASGASATIAAGASGVPGAAHAGAASGASATAVAGGASGASGAMPAMPSGASDAILGGDMKMPPLPPPEPPMVRYWRAYSDCMQNRGYFVR
jgi:hypothetical protein